MGDVAGFFLHDAVDGEGANTVYTITQIRFRRVMSIRLTGGPSQQAFWVQPASYAGPAIILNSNAPGAHGLAGRIALVR